MYILYTENLYTIQMQYCVLLKFIKDRIYLVLLLILVHVLLLRCLNFRPLA